MYVVWYTSGVNMATARSAMAVTDVLVVLAAVLMVDAGVVGDAVDILI